MLIASKKPETKESVFDRIKSRTDEVNYDRIGKAFDHQKDDLKKLMNIIIKTGLYLATKNLNYNG